VLLFKHTGPPTGSQMLHYDCKLGKSMLVLVVVIEDKTTHQSIDYVYRRQIDKGYLNEV
jgi:hypothetical protein